MFAIKLCSHLNHHCISLKNQDWRVEQEWRTVFTLLSNDQDERKARVQLRPDGRPYVDVRILGVEPDDVRLPITTVIAGVHADPRAIRHMLDQFGYEDVAVIHSGVAATDISRWPR
jgi:hypothetical protein